MTATDADKIVWTKEERQAFYRMDDIHQIASPLFWRLTEIAQELDLLSLILEGKTQEVERRAAEQREADLSDDSRSAGNRIASCRPVEPS